MRTPDYVQVVGFIDQTQINLQSDDTGGELDPHGADLVSRYVLQFSWPRSRFGFNSPFFSLVQSFHDVHGICTH